MTDAHDHPDDWYGEDGVLKKKHYKRELRRLQEELVKLQHHVESAGLRVCVVFEGRDAAGKGGTIKRIVRRCNPRVVRTVALGTPTEREQGQWYFQRYVEQLPTAGELVLFDRSWYNRAGVERVMGFCSDAEYERFLETCPTFERLLVDSGTVLLKYWFSVSDAEQERRFQSRNEDPRKRWKLSPMDLAARERWADYSRAKDRMFEHTDTEHAPWHVVHADVKRHARLNCISHLLDQFDYPDELPEQHELPPRPDDPTYRPPIDEQRWIPARYGSNPEAVGDGGDG
ncbi:polyphosphate kinase 2 [Haloglomus litoreum]|uniref:polyphosphate kinase 2 n=1 Tax=Haloglomus litoreum TaxID=3034026 RepID=UPI0023E8FA8E|nr:polyphosphate kinase 2 [Haloglomus sp. DT116]